MPAWANWWAMDEDGECYVFEKEPEMHTCSWLGGGRITEVFNQSYKGDWRDSLRKRP